MAKREPASNSIGKRVGFNLYFHISARRLIPTKVSHLLSAAEKIAQPPSGYNVIKTNTIDDTISFLEYRDFFSDPFPQLISSTHVAVHTEKVTFRSFADSTNPPILHRKELLLDPKHDEAANYRKLSASLDQVGLLEATQPIGFLQNWENWLRENGFLVRDHVLETIGNQTSDGGLDDLSEPIKRHRTAIDRVSFSAPMKLLERYGFLNGDFTLFDYGCGKGGDVERLRDLGVEASGWDPHFAPNEEKQTSDIVNLGFVINVIEHPFERVEALRSAYDLATHFIVVSVMLTNSSRGTAKQFSDGCKTGATTFQKYFTQSEFKEYLAITLDVEPYPIGPGICVLFKTEKASLNFLSRRISGRSRAREKHGRKRQGPIARNAIVLSGEQTSILSAYWDEALELGYFSEPSQNLREELIDQFGSIRRARNQVTQRFNQVALSEAADQRREDLVVLFAINKLRIRKGESVIDDQTLAASKALFGSMREVKALAMRLIEDVASPTQLESACQAAEQIGLGRSIETVGFVFHKAQLHRMPPVLRLRVWLAALVADDPESADLIKVHSSSEKVSFYTHANFDSQGLPELFTQEIVDLSRSKTFLRIPSERLVLKFKARYLSEEQSQFPSQERFDEVVEGIFDDHFGLHAPLEDVEKILCENHYQVSGMKLIRPDSPPDIDLRCGKNFTFRDLIECGETQEKLALPNTPVEPESYWALHDLATAILDPVIDYYGGIELTYGFCSSTLSRKISKHVAPKLDQHVSYERNQADKRICSRGGAAVDFVVADEDMKEVATWICRNLPFDRLYYYGQDRPLHVSFSQKTAGKAYEMITSTTGKRTPKPFKP